ncbi:MAG: SUMF1/EgtB/PvdO family nonheme iron enzyme [Verrucomicrobiales bacterium]
MKFVPVPGTDVLFCIHEVRYRDYEEYAKKAKENFDGAWKIQTNDGFEIKKDANDHPVTMVNWDDAQKFCAWLSEKEGVTYRLPTDREWSLAVGIGDQEDWKSDTTPATIFKVPVVFPWGDMWPPPAGAGNYSDASRRASAPGDDARYVAGDYDDTFPTTAPVMSFAANKLGLYDLGGNVWEWCDDLYSGEQKERMLRGGSWSGHERGNLLSSFRHRSAPGHRGNYFGFRVVLKLATTPDPIAKPSAPPASPPAAKDAPFVNSLGMKFVPVSGTEVRFCIHEVRYRDYAEYAKNADRSINGFWQNQTQDGFENITDAKDHPVTRVSWDDAQNFCAWLSNKEGRAYRLPTDREWSLAVGIGGEESWTAETTIANVFKPQDSFPWGSGWPPPLGAGNYSDESCKAEAPRRNANYLDGYNDGFPTTAPVMSFEPNGIGLYDLGGNVWEWCEDSYSGKRDDSVLRGGSWYDCERSLLLSSARRRGTPDLRYIYYGFRVVLMVTSRG